MAGSQSVGTTIQIDGESAWVGATVSWDNNLNVTVSNIYCNGVSDDRWTWRITGSYSAGDTRQYAGEGVGYSFTSPQDGKTFVFGASPAYNNVSTGAWTNTNGIFVVSSSSSGGNTGGGNTGGNTGGGSSSDDSISCGVIYIIKGEGVKTLNVTRISSKYGNEGTIYNGSPIWVNDYFDIDVEAEDGYELDLYSMSNISGTYDGVPFDSTNIGIISMRDNQAITVGILGRGDAIIRATTNGNSGGGVGGGGGTSSSNSSIYPTSGTQNGVTATFTISGSTVTVKVSSTNLYWRINGTNSGGDHGTYYISENRNSSGSFTAKDGHAYAFQVCSSSGTWSNGLIFYVNIGSGGGSSGGDDSGGSSSGGTNSGLKTYTVTALGVTAEVAYTSGPEVTVTIKSWSGYGSIPYWRVKGRASQGDYNTYLSQTNASSASFNSYDGYNNGGKEYVFQVCRNGTWGNDNGENSIFLVDFSLSGNGSGGEVVDSYTMYFNEGEGTNLTITRTSSTYGSTGTMYENGNIYYDDIWANDRFEIVVEAQEGYQLNELVVDGLQYENGIYTFSGSGNASIATYATLITSARIFNKNTSSWNTYGLYIYNGSDWNRYRPYIYKGSSWNLYS